jgi:hypothetical protein
MKVALLKNSKGDWEKQIDNDVLEPKRVQLVICFGLKQKLKEEKIYQQLRTQFPQALIVLNSGSGEIIGNEIKEDHVIATAIEFDSTQVEAVQVRIDDYKGNSYAAGKAIAEKFKEGKDPSYLMLISDGTLVNGSELVKGINEIFGGRIPVTGGLAGDGTDFASTVVGLNAEPTGGNIVGVFFKGKNLQVNYGSKGGWEIFGPERTVTKSSGNQLYEINGEGALDLYKKYLGNYAVELPRSAFLFPLSVKFTDESEPVVRTILQIDQDSNSMIFAGDIPEGSKVRFMKANFDRLIEAAGRAAHAASSPGRPPKLALLISCVGRKIILESRSEEEVEAVREAFGNKTKLTGFYSYGEISPLTNSSDCALHNQTMTITTIDEI